MTWRPIVLDQVHRAMHSRAIDLLLVNSPANVWYLSGYPLALSGLQGRGYGRNATVLVPRGGNPVLVPGRFEEQISRARAWVTDIEPFEDYVQIPVVAAGEVAQRRGFPMSRIGIELEHLSVRFVGALACAFPHSELVPVDTMLDQIRAIKQNEEIAGITSVYADVCDAIRQALRKRPPAGRESELHNHITVAIIRGLWSEKVDGSVVAGERIAVWNGQALPIEIRPGGWVRLEYTCARDGYPARLCRMGVVGVPAAEQARRFRRYVGAVRTGLGILRPGVAGKDVWQALTESLMSGGLEPAGGAVGFGLGYGPIERPYLSEHEDEVLRPGMVLSIEPGTREGLRANWIAVLEPGGSRLVQTALPPEELITLA